MSTKIVCDGCEKDITGTDVTGYTRFAFFANSTVNNKPNIPIVFRVALWSVGEVGRLECSSPMDIHFCEVCVNAACIKALEKRKSGNL